MAGPTTVTPVGAHLDGRHATDRDKRLPSWGARLCCCLRMRHEVAFVWIVLVLLWGVAAPIKEYVAATVALDTTQEHKLVVRANYQGYAMLSRLLTEFVNISFNGSIERSVDDVATYTPALERPAVQFYTLELLQANLPVLPDANYSELLRRYGIADSIMSKNSYATNVQLCQTFPNYWEDEFTNDFHGKPTVWGGAVVANDMGCVADPLVERNSPHTWLGGMYCIGGFDIIRSTEQILMWSGFTSNHSIWKYNREFWGSVSSSLGPCVNEKNGTVLDAIITLQRICRRYDLPRESCLFPVSWLVNLDSKLQWTSNGFGVLNANWQTAYHAVMQSSYRFSNEFQTTLLPLTNYHYLTTDHPWQLFYTTECGTAIPDAFWNSNYTREVRRVIDACYRRYYSSAYIQGFQADRATDARITIGAVRYEYEQNTSADPVIRLPPRVTLTPPEIERTSYHSVFNTVQNLQARDATHSRSFRGILLCVKSCQPLCDSQKVLFSNHQDLSVSVVTRRPGGICEPFAITNEIISQSMPKCIAPISQNTPPISPANATWTVMYDHVIAYSREGERWKRLQDLASPMQADFGCVFLSATAPAYLTTIETVHQQLMLESFLLRFAHFGRFDVGMITQTDLTLDPSVAVTQVLTVLFLIGTVAHGFLMLYLLILWWRIRTIYHPHSNPMTLASCYLDYAGIAHARSRVRQLTMCSSVKMLVSWFATKYAFVVTSVGIILKAQPMHHHVIETLVGMSTSIWIAMEINCARGNTAFLERTYTYGALYLLFGAIYLFSDYGQAWNAGFSRWIQFDEYICAVCVTTMLILVVQYTCRWYFAYQRRKRTLVAIPPSWSCYELLRRLDVNAIDLRLVLATKVGGELDTNMLVNIILRKAALESVRQFEFRSKLVRHRSPTIPQLSTRQVHNNEQMNVSS